MTRGCEIAGNDSHGSGCSREDRVALAARTDLASARGRPASGAIDATSPAGTLGAMVCPGRKCVLSEPRKSRFIVGTRVARLLVSGVCLILGAVVMGAEEPLRSTADTPSYSIRVWQTESGLPQNSVTAIAQDREGYLWLGTYDGLARFDGVRFVVFDGLNTPALENGRITSLFAARDGTLWIGHETGNVTQRVGDSFIARKPAPPAPNPGIVAIGEDLHGKICVLDQSGQLERVDDGSVLVPDDQISDPSPFLLFAARPSGGFALARNGMLSTLGDQGLQSVKLADHPGDTGIYGMAASRKGGLWLIAEGQVRRWQAGRWVETRGQTPWNATMAATAVTELHNGALAVGTLGAGLYLLFEGRPPIHFDRTNGLPHDRIRAIYEDPEGNVWVGTGSGGLVALREACFTTLRLPDRSTGESVLAVTPSREGGLWVGTEGGGLYLYRKGTWQHFGANDGLASDYIWSLAESPEHELWVGTWGAGLFRKQRYGRFYPEPALAASIPILALCLPPDRPEIWIGTRSGFISLDADRKARLTGAQAGLVSPDVRAVVEDEAGTIWIGMVGGGLASIKDGVIRTYGRKDGLSSTSVQSLLVDRAGVLWIGTTDAGLNRLKDGRITSIDSRQGLPGNVISHIADDGRGFLWIGSHNGVFRLAKSDANRCADGLSPVVHCQQFGRGDGLSSLECTGGQAAGCRTPDGRLWFSTTAGLVTVDPTAVTANQLPPKTVIEELRIDGIVIPRPSGPTKIPPGRRRIELQYTGLSFAAAEKVNFRHRLIGLEDGWTEAGAAREVSYNYLPPGHYRFEVLACNNDGVWAATPAQREFTVLPFVWQTWWFRSLGVLALSGVAGLTGRAMTRRRMKQRVERAERQHALERERARIARDIHDDLGASLTRVALLSQSARGEVPDSGAAAHDLDQIFRTTREVTRALDEIVWAVNPKHDTLDSLVTYLGKFAEDFVRAAGMRCRLEIAMELPSWRLTSEIRHNVFLAFKETLHNIVRHAGATEVRIGLAVERTAKTFALIIEDNGRGFDSAQNAGVVTTEPDRIIAGHGLANLRERLAEIDGRYEVASQPGHGTRVSLIVALRLAED